MESVPDGLAGGLLAGVNPLAGLYAYLFGLVGAALVTSSSFMAVQATGAMSLVVADTGLGARPDPERALFTLSAVTGVVLIVAGLLKAGRLLRFVPTAVMTGFMTAVGVNIVLGQLANFTGYASAAGNRVLRALDTLTHPGRIDLATLIVGVVTVAGILLLQRTRLGALGLVVAIVVGSLLALGIDSWWGRHVQRLSDIAAVPRTLPAPVLPVWTDVPALIVPALSLAFIAMVQSAGVSAVLPTPDGRPANASQDFIGQGAGNIVSGLFRGMPVGGSMSASALVVQAGARTRLALLIAGGVMAVVVLTLAGVVGAVAMPALAALLMVVGVATIKPPQIRSVIKSGPFQTAALAVTFVLTLLIPVEYAVLVGVGFAIVMHVAEQSNRLRLRRLLLTEGGRIREVDPPAELPPGQVLVLQPYGSLFFASAPTFEQALPTPEADGSPAVVVLRLRGVDQLGLAALEVLRRYAQSLLTAGSTLKLVVTDDAVRAQLDAAGVSALIGSSNVYRGSEWQGETVRRAYDDGVREIAASRPPGGSTHR